MLTILWFQPGWSDFFITIVVTSWALSPITSNEILKSLNTLPELMVRADVGTEKDAKNNTANTVTTGFTFILLLLFSLFFLEFQGYLVFLELGVL